jgi:alpha-L-rhamnosidase
MNRISGFILGGCILAGCAPGENGHPEDGLPNIIFILTDDQRWDALGYAGNNEIWTPEMDKLAREGNYFRNAFVTTPICAAARASFFTGLYERTHGYTFQQGEIDQAFMDVSYPALMMESPYHTGFFGKFGVSYSLRDNLFDEAEVYDRNDSYSDRRGFFYKTVDGDTVHLTRYTGHRAIEFIKNTPEGKPFCLSLSFSAPHAHDRAPDQFFWSPGLDTLYQDNDIGQARMASEQFFMEQPVYVREGFNRARWYWRFDTPEKYQLSMKGYYRMISGIDLEIGRIRHLLESRGIADNTIIIFMSDNGYFTGERQLAGKWLMYEPSVRVPLIIYDPRNRDQRDIEDLVLNIDIPSTILDYAGIDIPSGYQGISLADYGKNENPAEDREHFLIEHLWDFEHIPPSEGIRTKKWKYFRYINDPGHEELYDMVRDTDEIRNLADHGQYQGVLEEMRMKTDSIILKLVEPVSDH